MRSTADSLVYLFVAGKASALSARQDFSQPPSGGISGSGIAGSLVDIHGGSEQQAEQLFENAGRTPNKTNSASFNFDQDDRWTWNVNITDVTVPYEFYKTSGLHVVNTQWDLQWPGGGTLQSYMARSRKNDTLCLSATYITLPNNITGRYSGPGNCSTVLGSECAASILSSFSCAPGPSISFSEDLKGCEDTLVGHDATGVYGFIYTINPALQNTTESGNTTVFFDTSRPVPAASLTRLYDQAESRLNVLLLGYAPDASDGQMLCQIVDQTASSDANTHLGGHWFWTILAVGWALVLA